MNKTEILQKIRDEVVDYVDSYTLDGVAYGLGGLKTEWITQFIETPKVIFDVGCYDCGDSIRFKNTFTDCEVYAFEASPTRYAMTKSNAERYKINLFNLAVSDQNGEKQFFDSLVDGNRVDAQGSFYKHSQFYKNRNPRIKQNEKAITIPSITVDTFCKNHNIKDIDVLHVDVEGAEILVIKGMKELLPKIIFVETLDLIDNNKNPSWEDSATNSLEMEKYLIERGYVLGKILSADRLYYHNSIIG